MLYSLTGFPFDLLWAILIALIYRPKFNFYFLGIISMSLIIPGFIMPPSFQMMYWSPGGAAMVLISTLIILFALTHDSWLKDKKVEYIPDRKHIREEIVKIEQVEVRQREYLKIVQKIGISVERNNPLLLVPNTIFFIGSFVLLFLITFSGLAYVHLKNPDHIKNIFLEFYTTVAASPGSFDEWYNSFMQLAAFQVFIADMIFFLLILSVMSKILVYRNLRKPGMGDMAYVQIPYFFLWIFIVSGACFFAVLKLEYHGIYLFIAKNLFFIISSFFVFQGISIFWLYLQVRLLPAASIILSIIITAFLFDVLSMIIFSVLLLGGLTDFWFEFRKKALHPKLFSDDA
ncbi:MAG: DUF2232 domain-containing protein [Spirochaetia bacterium]|nr:DUF2232 domain-containing protein [Spirochaetia bacterium]